MKTDMLGIYEDAVDILPDFVKQNIGLIGAGVGGAALGAAGAATVLKITGGVSKRKTTTRRRKTKTKKRRKLTPRQRMIRRIKKRPGRQSPYTAGARKPSRYKHSTRRIRYTKNGQPYVLMRSGKAKFIKKKSAKRSHKTKGGRY